MMFKWRCGSYPPRVFEAEDVEILREQVLEHLRHSAQRGLPEPPCGHCGERVSELTLIRHTTYSDDPSDGPACGMLTGLQTMTGTP